MKIEVRELMDDNKILSHIFLGCIPTEKLVKIKGKYVGEVDWREESVKIPVEMKIGGVAVNPKKFFNLLEDQIQRMILDRAKELVAEKLGSEKFRVMQAKLFEFEQVLEEWESEINWDVENPLI